MQLFPIVQLWLLASATALYLPFKRPNFVAQVPIISALFKPDDGYMTNPQFESWIDTQLNSSFEYILENIGGVLTKLDASEVAYGVVVASPLKKHPNYFYMWTRDSALTIRSLIYRLKDVHDEKTTDKLRNVVERYIEVNYHLQRLPNLSGKFDDANRAGLGEPKFMPDVTTFDENWGRPQSDGPGLRTLTIILYLHYLNKHGKTIENEFLGNNTFVYQEIIKPDLEYVMANWNVDLFDLWEEINANHFFNSLTQLRALGDGKALAEKLGDSQEFIGALLDLFDKLLSYIEDPATGYVRSNLPYIVETPRLFTEAKRLGLDAATLLAALHAHNLEYGSTENIPYDVDDSHVLNTISAMVSDMRYRYPINHDKVRFPQNIGVALGRYPEDIYDGYGTSEGNPWFISTASAAEIFFKWIYKTVAKESDIVITSFNRDFFGALDGELSEDAAGSDEFVIPYGSDRYRRILVSMFNLSDSFLDIIRTHADSVTGRMLEQFNKYHGYMQGADNLTWSYLSFYNCVRWRLRASSLIEAIPRASKL